MSNDFIPSNDDEFDHMTANINNLIANGYADYGLSSTQSAAYATARNVWAPAWIAYQDAQNALRAALADKDQARAPLERLTRELNAIIQATVSVTPAMKDLIGLPVHKTTRTAVPAPGTHPVLYRVDNEHLLQQLWFSDQATPGSKAKPAGVSLCEIRQLLVAPGGAAPTTSDAMPLLALDTKSPHRTDFQETDLGHTAYYAQRWVNTRGEAGPWGVITSYQVV